MKELLLVKFSTKDSLKRPKEEAAYMFFVDFLDECEGNLADI